MEGKNREEKEFLPIGSIVVVKGTVKKSWLSSQLSKNLQSKFLLAFHHDYSTFLLRKEADARGKGGLCEHGRGAEIF